MVDYKINGNKVSCVIFVNKKSGKVGYVGRAKCNPGDTFDVEFGKELAYKRALLKLKKAETRSHRAYINEREPLIHAYKHHQKAYEHNHKRVDELKQEIATMLSND
jgi:DNA topoisomerase VI subunit B